MTRPFEICGALCGGFRICERLLEPEESCPEHPGAAVIVEDFEPDHDWLLDESEVRGG